MVIPLRSGWKERVVAILVILMFVSEAAFSTQFTQTGEEYVLDVVDYEDDITQFLHSSVVNSTDVYVTDVSSASFTLSWVSSVPVNGSVEYCEYSAGTCDQNGLGSTSTVSDGSPFLSSGAVLVTVPSLSQNTTYYYRARAETSTGDVRYYPKGPPYPSVRTKNSTQPGYASNPTFNIAPYEDKNDNDSWDGEPTDAKQYYFLVYLNHSGTGTLAARASSLSGWVATIPTSNLRDDDVEGAPHQLGNGDTLTFFIAGTYQSGLWSNYTASVTWDGSEDPVDRIWETSSSTYANTGYWTDTFRDASTTPKSDTLAAIISTTPIVSDVTSGKFRLSWVSDVPIAGAVEYCASGPGCSASTLGSTTTVTDASTYLSSGAALVDVGPLSSGTTYYYRLRATTQDGDVAYYPSSPPYPSVTTKTDTNPGYASNPTFNIVPYEDRNGNSAWDGAPPDAKQNYFLVYLNHSGAGTLVSRGNPWIASLPTANLRDDTSAGAPHKVNSGDQFTFWLVGSYNDGQRTTLWRNATPAYTWSGGSPINLAYRTERLSQFTGERVFTSLHEWSMDPDMGSQYGGDKKVQGIFSKLWLEGEESGMPRVSDVTTARFRVSWVNEAPSTGSVEYSTNADLSGSSTVTDSSPNLANGTSLVTVTSLSAGTTYYYRVRVTNSTGGDVRYYPSSPPYPPVTTKTSTDVGSISNPVFNFAVYNDSNGNGNYDSGEPKLKYFLVYFSHGGAGVMVARGSAGSGWIATIDTKNLRDDTPEGAPHQFSTGDVFNLTVRGLYDDGSGLTLWKNQSYTMTWDGSTTSFYVRCERSSFTGLSGEFTARLRFSAPTPGYLGTIWVDFNGSGWHGGGLSPFHDISMYDANTGVASGSGEIAYTSTGGTGFLVSNDTDLTGYEWYGASMGSASDAWSAGGNGTLYRIMKSSDGGATWSLQTQGSGTLRSISFSGTSNGVAVGDASILYTTDGGSTWSTSSDPDIGSTRYDRVMLTGVKAIAVGDSGRILVNSDITAGSGGDWVPKTSGTTADLHGVAITGSNVIAVGEGVILYSSDGGDTWTASTSIRADGYTYRDVSFAGGSSLAWAVGERGRLLKSTDGGATWSFNYSDTVADLLSIDTPTSTSGIISGEQGTLSAYGGSAWGVHSVPSGEELTLRLTLTGTRSGNLTLKYDTTGYDSRYSIKAVSLARCEYVKTYWESGVATEQWAARYDNENTDNDTVILKATVNMTDTLFNNSEIDRVYLTVRNQSSDAVVWQGYMSKESEPDAQHAVFSVTIDISTWVDGKYVAVADAYEVDTSSDAAFGETNAKTAYLVVV